jgi:hypothetical protein
MKLRNTLLVSTSSLLLLALPSHAEDNTLTEAEKAAGWQLLFDGKSLDGWHRFKQ